MNIGLIILGVAILLYLIFAMKGQTTGNFANIKAAELNQWKKDNPKGIIIDVRTPQEVKAGKLKGAIEANVMGGDFIQKISKLDPNKPYLLYCRSGKRSANACVIMSKNGFEQVYNLVGGYGAVKKG